MEFICIAIALVAAAVGLALFKRSTRADGPPASSTTAPAPTMTPSTPARATETAKRRAAAPSEAAATVRPAACARTLAIQPSPPQTRFPTPADALPASSSAGPAAASPRSAARPSGQLAPTATPIDIPLELARPTRLPARLAAHRPLAAGSLNGERKLHFVKAFCQVPRPPKLLHHLLSSEFVASASSAELEDLIVGEPLIAAKVLATVNSPLFGLKTQVRSIRQAVSYLGLDAVRSVCLQYILIASFKADSTEREAILDSTWRASALASELVQHLAHKLALADASAMVSAVVLSFLGRLATAATMPRPLLTAIPENSLLERATAEQAALGLSASEIGRLLMIDWELPKQIAQDAADIDRVLTTAHLAGDSADTARAARLALCYLCARLAERLASGLLEDLSEYDLLSERSADHHHLWSYFDDARMVRLAEILRSRELDTRLRKMLNSMREPEICV